MTWLTLQHLKAKDANTRLRAMQKLCQSPSPNCIPHVADLLDDLSAEVRLMVVQFLRLTRDAQSLPLIGRALRDPDPEVRKLAVVALGAIGDPCAVPWLIHVLKDEHPAVRSYAASALEKLGWSPDDEESSISCDVARGAFGKAAAQGSVAITPLINTLRQSGSTTGTIAAIEALSQIGDERVVAPLIRCLKSEEGAVRVAAVYALAAVGNDKALPALIGLARDREHHVRAAALKAVSKLAQGQCLDVLIAALKDKSWDVRLAAVESLGKLKDPQAIDELIQLGNDRDGDVREAVAVALGQIDDPRALSLLTLLLIDENSSVRRAADTALKSIDPRWPRSRAAQATVPQLKAALRHKDYWVRHCASAVSGKIERGETDEDNLPSFLRKPNAPPHGTASFFVNLLQDPDQDLRQAAAEVLGQIGRGCGETVPALKRLLDDADPGVEQAARASLLRLQGS